MRFHRYSHWCAQGEGATGGRRPLSVGISVSSVRRRFFGKGDVRLIILKLISQKPSHGYETAKAIEDRLGGAYSPVRESSIRP